jgi:hypothetical protein
MSANLTWGLPIFFYGKILDEIGVQSLNFVGSIELFQNSGVEPVGLPIFSNDFIWLIFNGATCGPHKTIKKARSLLDLAKFF